MPDPPQEQAKWLSTALSAIKSIAGFIALAAKEWLPALIDQPIRPPMEHNAGFEDEWGRISRLITIVIIISSLLLGGLNIFAGEIDVRETLKSAFVTIVIAFILALLYRPFAYICGVRVRPPGLAVAAEKRQQVPTDDSQAPSKSQVSTNNTQIAPVISQKKAPLITLRQIMFVELYTFVPWIPIFCFIYATVSVTHGGVRDFLLLAPYICFVYALINFGKAIKLITDCSWPRIWLSLSVPIAIWLFEVVPVLAVILFLVYMSLAGKT